MTLAANFENFYFSPDSTLDFRKCYQVCCLNWLKNKKVTGRKTNKVEFFNHTQKTKSIKKFSFSRVMSLPCYDTGNRDQSY